MTGRVYPRLECLSTFTGIKPTQRREDAPAPNAAVRKSMESKQFLEAWEIHNRISLYLLDAIEPAALKSYSASKGRSVGEQFAHVHNVRLMWLKAAAPDLLKGLTKLEKEQANDQKLLCKSLADSGEAIKSLLSGNGVFVKHQQSHAVFG